jgi:hypothetical protein
MKQHGRTTIGMPAADSNREQKDATAPRPAQRANEQW